MALESVTNIADLVAANPAAGDPKSQGDDHIRLLKTVLLAAFTGISGAIMVSGTDGGAANAYTLTPTIPLPAYGNRMLVIFAPTVNNTGASTINISSLGVKSIKTVAGAALALGDLVVGQVYMAIYNGTEFRLLSITKNYVDQLAISGTVPGVNTPANAGKFFTTDGTTGSWAAVSTDPLFVDKGDSGTTAQVMDYSAGQNQRVKVTGIFALSVSNWPAAGRLGTLLVELVNGAAFAFTWGTTVNWVKADGTTTTSLASSGATLQASGTDFALLWTRNGGSTVYGKIVR